MKAIALTKYGSPDGLQLTEVEKPTPKGNEVLIRVRATTVTAGNTEIRTLNFPVWLMLPVRLYIGFIRPRNFILGQELAGDIVAVGKNVTRFKVGDPVFASTFEVNFGGYAEYKCMPADGLLALKPENFSFEEAAAAVGGGVTAMRCLRNGHIQSEQQVLIYGASGAVGSNAVQLAKHHFGADVTAVCSGKLDFMRSLGADHVIDYTQEDFTRNGKQYDLILDVIAHRSVFDDERALSSNGRYLGVGGSVMTLFQILLFGSRIRKTTGKQVGILAVQPNPQDMVYITELCQAGKLVPVIDRRY